MSIHKTADEIQNRYIEKMGQELGSIYYALKNELSWLYLKWDQYVKLFGTEPSQVELLDQVAGQFFGTVQNMYWETTMLHITRLTDPPKSCGKDNLTIKRLPKLIKQPQLTKDVEELIGVADKKADFCRDWRNRHLAHRDFDLAMKNGAKSLDTANPVGVEAALGSISEVLNKIRNHYMESTFAFDAVDGKIAGLIRILESGLRNKKESRGLGNIGKEI